MRTLSMCSMECVRNKGEAKELQDKLDRCTEPKGPYVIVDTIDR